MAQIIDGMLIEDCPGPKGHQYARGLCRYCHCPETAQDVDRAIAAVEGDIEREAEQALQSAIK